MNHFGLTNKRIKIGKNSFIFLFGRDTFWANFHKIKCVGGDVIIKIQCSKSKKFFLSKSLFPNMRNIRFQTFCYVRFCNPKKLITVSEHLAKIMQNVFQRKILFIVNVRLVGPDRLVQKIIMNVLIRLTIDWSLFIYLMFIIIIYFYNDFNLLFLNLFNLFPIRAW